MENSLDSSSISSSRSCNAESFYELKHMLMRTTLELESQKQMFDAKVKHLEGLLKATQRERDDALHRCMELQSGVSRSSSSLASIFSNTSERSSSDWLSFELEQMNQQQQSENNNNNNVAENAHSWHFGNDSLVSDFHMAAASTGFQGPPHGTGTMRGCTATTVSGYLGSDHIGEAYPSILLQDTHSGHLLEPPELPAAPTTTEAAMNVLIQGSLPARGRMLEAVMQAGPLLHTLLLAGPLPQWHHPPPAHFQIPSVSMATGSMDLEQHHQASTCDFASMSGSGFVSSVSSTKSEPVGFLHSPQAAVFPAGFVTSSTARRQAAVAGLPARRSSSREEHLGHPPQHSMQQQDAKHHLRPLIKCAKAC